MPRRGPSRVSCAISGPRSSAALSLAMRAGPPDCRRRQSDMMTISRETFGSVIGGTAVAAALAYFAITHEPPALSQDERVTLNIPTVEQMCAALGATDPQSLM